MPINSQHDFTCFCTLRHYVIVNLNVNENHVQYVQSKTDDPPRVTQCTVRDLSYGKKLEKKNENQCHTSFHDGLEWRLSNVRAIDMLTAGMSARDVARHFQRHESTISRLLNKFQQTRNIADRPRSGRPCKTTPREDRFLTTSSRRNRFLSSQKLVRLLRNATGTRVCDRTVMNSLHVTRLKRAVRTLAFRWYDGIIEPVVVTYLQQHKVGIFQHDNAYPHTAKHTQNMLRIHNVNVLQWPARSPDLFPQKSIRSELAKFFSISIYALISIEFSALFPVNLHKCNIYLWSDILCI